MKRPSINQYLMTMAFQVATRATCEEAQVGSVLVSKDNHILATGYNGSPAGQSECLGKASCKLLRDRGKSGVYQLCPTIHAEANAISQYRAAYGKPHAPKGSRIYVTTAPCLSCLQQLLAAGVNHVVYGSSNSWLSVAQDYTKYMPDVYLEKYYLRANSSAPLLLHCKDPHTHGCQ